MLLLTVAALPILRRTVTKFTLAAVVGSARRSLAVIVAVLAIVGASYLTTHKLNNPDHYAYGGCGVESHIGTTLITGRPSCAPPTRAVWQIPLAVMIAVLGFGAAVAAAGPHWRPAHESVLSGLDL